MPQSGNVIFRLTINANASQAIRNIQAVGAALGQLGQQVAKASARAASFSFGNLLSPGALQGANAFTNAVQSQVGTALTDLQDNLKRTSYFGIRAFDYLGNAVRQFAQGVMEASRMITFFVATPLAILEGLAGKIVTEYEELLVRVRKTTQQIGETTGQANARVARLNQLLLDYAKYTATPLNTLAQWAVEAGQLGMSQADTIMRLIYLADQLSLATDLGSEQIIRALGRIAYAFGMDLNTEEGIRELEEFADVMNYLENTTAVTAGEIVEAVLDAANIGNLLKIPAKDMAVLMAYAVQAGSSAQAAGTRIASWYVSVINKSERLFGVLRNLRRETGDFAYKTNEDIIKAFNTDPVQVFIDTLKAIELAPLEQRADLLKEIFGATGMVGGRLLATASSVYELADALEKVRAGVARGSLWQEYNMALSTTNAHLGVLRNNLSVLAVQFSSAVLPAINRFIEFVIPAVQILGAEFLKLSDRTKLFIVAIPPLIALSAILGVVLGTITHALSLASLGVKALIFSVYNGGKAFWFFISTIGSVVKLFTPFIAQTIRLVLTAGSLRVAIGILATSFLKFIGILGLVASGLYIVLKVFQTFGVDLIGMMRNIATRMYEWGARIVGSFAEGMARGISAVVSIAKAIGRVISLFFEAHSPPKMGVLSNIDKWGKGLMDTYLKGFLNADWDILSTVGSFIREGLDYLVSLGEMSGEAMGEALLNARSAIAQVIETFNRTGQIAEDVLSRIADNLGDIAPDIQRLIRLWLQYNQTQKELKALEERRKGVLKSYDEEIRRIAKLNLTAEEARRTHASGNAKSR